jgi:RNase H-fold protein (predicted Holliday junction resolvase)
MSFHSVPERFLQNSRHFWERTITQTTLNRGRIVGLDMSPSRIGVAVSDDRQEFALPLGTLHVAHQGGNLNVTNKQGISVVKRLKQDGRSIAGWIVGWPLNLHGQLSHRTKATVSMIDQLQKLLEITFDNILLHDERYSTALARADALDRPDAATIGLDSLAAARILQEYLDLSCRFQPGTP